MIEVKNINFIIAFILSSAYDFLLRSDGTRSDTSDLVSSRVLVKNRGDMNAGYRDLQEFTMKHLISLEDPKGRKVLFSNTRISLV